MGINNTSVVSTTNPPIVQRYTAVGWTSGDYLYNSASGVVGIPSGTVSAGGPVTTLQATNLSLTAGLFSGTQTVINPLTSTVTYSGPNVTANSVFAEGNVSSTATAGAFVRCASLTNGNVVVSYYDNSATTPGYYYKIYDSYGNTIVAATLILAITAGQKASIPVALADGSFRIGYFNGTTGLWYSAAYTSAGVLTGTTSGTPGQQPQNGTALRAIQLTNGSVVYAFCGPNYINHMLFNSSNAFVTGGNVSTAYMQPYSYGGFGLYPLPDSVTSAPNGYGFIAWSNNQGSQCYAVVNASGSVVAANTTSGGGFSGIDYYTQDMILLQDGTYVYVGGNSGNSYTAKKVSIATNGFPTAGGASYNFSNSVSYSGDIKIIPRAGSGFAILYYDYGSNSSIYMVKSTGLTSSVSALSSQEVVGYGYYSTGLGAACTTNGGLFLTYDNGGGAPYFRTTPAYGLVTGTVYVGTAITPPNYIFFGIAQNTTSAGSVGNVIVAGQALANTSMPSVSGLLNFDTTQTTVPGNSGSVTGRVFNLKGLA